MVIFIILVLLVTHWVVSNVFQKSVVVGVFVLYRITPFTFKAREIKQTLSLCRLDTHTHTSTSITLPFLVGGSCFLSKLY